MKKSYQTVIICTLAGLLLGALVARLIPASAHASLAFTVAEQGRQETTDYSYDGYYAIRATELISDTLISWLSTPSIVKEIYDGAGQHVTDAQATQAAGRVFRAKKLSSQNVVVTFTTRNQQDAQKLADQASQVLSARATELVRSSKNDSLFVVTASDPVIAVSSPDPKRGALVGLCLGLFLGFILVYATDAKKKP